MTVEVNLLEVLELHRRIVPRSGGRLSVRDIDALESAIAQPKITFGGQELYPSVIEKAAALGFSLILNHPFVDGNKRVGHATMRLFLLRNGFRINASVDEQEAIILQLAAGKLSHTEWTAWLQAHVEETR